MLKSLVEIRKKILKFLTIFSPAITIFIVYFLKIDIVVFLSRFSDTLANEIKDKPNLGFTINSAIVLIIISLIIEFLKYPGKFEIGLENNSRKSDSYFYVRQGSDRHITVHIDCKLNYKNLFLRTFIYKLGGLSLNVEIPEWLDYKIDNEQDLKGKILLQEKMKFQVDIDRAIQRKKVESLLYIKVLILSKSFDLNYGSIIPTVEPISKKKIKRFFLYIVIWLFFDIKANNYKVEARNDIF
ncbi:hypothetical protein KS08_06070 [Bacillus subtilis]|uniref:hypothetical protein n=1 Tax=Bacillus amyloliquefaciens group TaxID=1938374 RepID=UPI00052A9C2B|nr:hypothetical protein [Bacillus amyloliquefaciens]AIW33224.1 hypothetical protein KS08_06070 [Bacillus subtilis]MEC1831903.1 hypothetical protein [Bacillus amyloliquefaciens]MEC1835689.1 hypothetical protein [Bacillus amyloliquefaciens]MEC1844319.1 hypothetical protein [Bacillus amyloliquefaciens]MEC1872600.1 hypothetical protein [Bacillus amyloliquefaciens]